LNLEFVCPAATNAVLGVRQGGTVEFARLRRDPRGYPQGRDVRLVRRLRDVAGTAGKNGYLGVLARRGDKTTEAIDISGTTHGTPCCCRPPGRTGGKGIPRPICRESVGPAAAGGKATGPRSG
jgi:hypothetical protein